MRTVDTCPACQMSERTIVMEHNGLVLLDYMRHSPLCRYDYALCHCCGLVYASKRPEGEELDFLYSRFDEFLGRTQRRAGALSPAEEADIRRRARGGWLVSEEDQPATDTWLPEALGKRLTSSYHVNIIAALTPLQGARILELRSTTGFMLDIFRKHHGAAEVFAMPMTPRDQLIIQELNPMPSALIDFDTLEIPFDGQFDLILARHMCTHMLDLGRLWQFFRERLRPGGRVYLYLENDDASMYARKKNLLGEMKCFHFQNFDLPGLARALRYHQLEPEFIRHPFGLKSSEMLCATCAPRTSKAICCVGVTQLPAPLISRAVSDSVIWMSTVSMPMLVQSPMIDASTGAAGLLHAAPAMRSASRGMSDGLRIGLSGRRVGVRVPARAVEGDLMA